MEILPDIGKLPGGLKGIRYFGVKIRLSIQKVLALFKKKT
jgi:hypothetical protein